MRDYGTVASQFWVRGTGKELRGDKDAQIVALYLMTSPHANMIGVFHLPVMYLAHETGLSIADAQAALVRLTAKDFCTYEEDSEWICVHRFAANQIGEELKDGDKRIKGVLNELAKIPLGPCHDAFTSRYGAPYHLGLSPSEAPSKPLRSQKQIQKQKQKGEGASPSPLPDWIPPEAWDGYVAMRVKARKPMTDRARDLVIAELENLRGQGQDVGAVLDQSTVKAWTDVYPVKGRQAAPSADPYGLRDAV
jgi:hypothetical protein